MHCGLFCDAHVEDEMCRVETALRHVGSREGAGEVKVS